MYIHINTVVHNIHTHIHIRYVIETLQKSRYISLSLYRHVHSILDHIQSNWQFHPEIVTPLELHPALTNTDPS